jgi:hypothetical protein
MIVNFDQFEVPIGLRIRILIELKLRLPRELNLRTSHVLRQYSIFGHEGWANIKNDIDILISDIILATTISQSHKLQNI